MWPIYFFEPFQCLSVLHACTHDQLCVLHTMQCPHPPQLVEVAGCNMWVMEETDGPSRDPPQMGHLRQRVHAQQFPSLEKKTMSLKMTGKLLLTQCVVERDAI